MNLCNNMSVKFIPRLKRVWTTSFNLFVSRIGLQLGHGGFIILHCKSPNFMELIIRSANPPNSCKKVTVTQHWALTPTALLHGLSGNYLHCCNFKVSGVAIKNDYMFGVLFWHNWEKLVSLFSLHPSVDCTKR